MGEVDIRIYDYIEKLERLEKALGAGVSYTIYEPFHLAKKTGGTLQVAINRMARFVGLPETFTVTVVEQAANVAGTIRTGGRGTSAVVAIDPSMCDIDDSNPVLATLAHELTHKVLIDRLLTYGAAPSLDYENEVFTDLAAVYLGFGKLMLNGCETVHTQWNHGARVRQTLTTGYLKRHQLAFIYRLVCAMRNIPRDKFEAGLTRDALDAVEQIEIKYGAYFDAGLNGVAGRERMDRMVQERIDRVDAINDRLESALNKLLTTHIAPLQEAVATAKHQIAATTKHQIAATTDDGHPGQEPHYNPTLKYLENIGYRKRSLATVEHLQQMEPMLRQHLEQCETYVRMAESPGVAPQLPDVKCHVCGTKIRFEKKRERRGWFSWLRV